MKNRIFAIFIVAAFLALSFSPAIAQQKPDPLLFVLDWIVYGRHTPYFTALEKGFYKDENIEATIQRGYGSADTIKRLAAGRADFALADMAGVVLARGNDNVKIKALAVVYAKTPHTLFVREGEGINSPKDMEGKSIAAPAGATVTSIFKGLEKANNVDGSKIKWAYVEPASLNALLLAKKADGMLEYIFNIVLLKKLGAQQGVKPKALLYSDFGLSFYANSLLTSDEMAAKKPDLIRRYVKATLKGLQYAFDNPDEAVTLIRKSHPEIEADVGKDELMLVKDLVMSDEAKKFGIGYMDQSKVQKTIDVMKEYMGLKAEVLAKDVHTNEFLPKKQ